jgi:hypothetical protein
MKTIQLTQDKVALVDDEDFEALNAVKWCAHRSRHTFYAVRTACWPELHARTNFPLTLWDM